MEKIKKMKVVKIDKYGFELEDGTYCEHFSVLDIIPTLEEFQKIYDKNVEIINQEINNK